MPHIDVKMLEGRDEETKKRFVERVAEIAAEELKFKPGHLTISIEEYSKEAWPGAVLDNIDRDKLIYGEVTYE